MRRVYFDNNATTPLLPEVRAAMEPYFSENFGNASSIHHHGQETRSAVEHARGIGGEVGRMRASEIVFTSGGTEADNLGIFGVVAVGDHVITSTIEHHAVLFSAQRLEEMGCAVTYIPVDSEGHCRSRCSPQRCGEHSAIDQDLGIDGNIGTAQPISSSRCAENSTA